MTCKCFIIPQEVLNRFASDPELSDAVRQNFHHSAQISALHRAVREQNNALTQGVIGLPLPRPPWQCRRECVERFVARRAGLQSTIPARGHA